MPRVFYPRESRVVTASAPHPEGTEYKISIGDEEWGVARMDIRNRIEVMLRKKENIDRNYSNKAVHIKC